MGTITTDTPLARMSGDRDSVPTPSELAAMLRVAFIRRQLAHTCTSRLVWTSDSAVRRA